MYALDPEGVKKFVDTWKSRVLPGFVARRLGYRQSLDELLTDIDRFLSTLHQETPLGPADLLHIGLEGTDELLHGSEYGPQILKVIAAGALLSVLFLAAQRRPTEPEPVEPVVVSEPEPLIDRIVPTNETGYEIGFALGEKLAGLYLLKKGAEHIGNVRERGADDEVAGRKITRFQQKNISLTKSPSQLDNEIERKKVKRLLDLPVGSKQKVD